MMPVRWHQHEKTIRHGFVDLSLDDAVAETFGTGAIAGQPADDDAWFQLYELIISHTKFAPAALRARLEDAGEEWPENPADLRKAVMELVCAEILPAALENHKLDGDLPDSPGDMEWSSETQVTDVDADAALEELDKRLGDELMAEFYQALREESTTEGENE